MKTKHIISLVVLFSFFYTNFIFAQFHFPYEESFDMSTKGWTASLHADSTATWSWGTQEIIGEDVFRLLSPSGGGAMVMIDEAVDNIDSRTLSVQGILIDANLGENVHLRFNQYLKMGPDDSAYIKVETKSASYTFPLNLNNSLDGETSGYNMQDIDISSATKGNSIFSISFVSETTTAVWIIDDVKVYNAINVTEPVSYIGDSLKAYNIPYDLDASNWPYVPNQVVVQFFTNTTELEKDAIREYMGVISIGSCCNNEIELWTEQAGGSDIPINERTEGDDGDDDDEAGVQNLEVNKYNFNQLQNPPPTPWASLDTRPSGLSRPSDSAVLIAILDTGVDYEHNDLTKYIWNNQSSNKCYENDFIGWNFVYDNNNPDDDHSHGTHVAGIIVENMLASGTPECGFRIMPLKTHTFNGTANLFDVTCATYYAINNGANVINDSWGFYGSSSQILKRAMEEAMAKDILIITSSGNDGIALDDTPSYPACDTVDNIITVGSHDVLGGDGLYNVSDFSNYSSTQVNILALGDDVLSSVPGANGMRDRKTGTSMASPAVAAILAREYCEKKISYKTVKSRIFDKALKVNTLGSKSEQGKILDMDSSPTSEDSNGSFYSWCQKNWLLLCCFIGVLVLILFWFWKKK